MEGNPGDVIGISMVFASVDRIKELEAKILSTEYIPDINLKNEVKNLFQDIVGKDEKVIETQPFEQEVGEATYDDVVTPDNVEVSSPTPFQEMLKGVRDVEIPDLDDFNEDVEADIIQMKPVGKYDFIQSLTEDDDSEMTEKLLLLNSISALIDDLKVSGCDISGIQEPNESYPLQHIRIFKKKLQMKYDGIRCREFVSEVVVLGAKGLEQVFNGRRKFGRHTPDLRGWNKKARMKIDRLHVETGQIVNGVLNKFDIGPVARIVMELIPSAISHMSMKSSSKSEMALYDANIGINTKWK